MPAVALDALPRGTGRIRLERVAGIAELTLDHPGAANAMSVGMMLDLAGVVDSLERERDPVVLLSGAGGDNFCAGGDLGAVRRHLMEPGAAAAMCTHMTDLLDRLSHLPGVVIAGVEGAAVGGGAELLTVADQVYAASNARIGFVHVRLGVSPGWGGSARLVQRVGSRAALLLLLPERLDAESARHCGLVDELVPPGQARARAHDRARALAALPADAVRAAVTLSRGPKPGTEAQLFTELWGGPAHLAALSALKKGQR